MIDKTAPTLTLISGQTVVIEANTPWTDPGATAVDNISRDVTSAIMAESNVNLAVPGEYWINYAVKDASGNYRFIARSVQVVQTTALSIQSATPSTAVLWLPNHKMIPIDLSVPTSDASAQARIVSVSSNLSVDAKGDGKTSADWQVTGSALRQPARRTHRQRHRPAHLHHHRRSGERGGQNGDHHCRLLCRTIKANKERSLHALALADEPRPSSCTHDARKV